MSKKPCRIPDCERPLCAKGLCRLHWERQHRTGTTDDPVRTKGGANPSWKGGEAGYSAAHLRMSSGPRPSECEKCGATSVRFEWALKPDTPPQYLSTSPEGYRYSDNPAHYTNLCKPCHGALDHRKDECHKGHPLSGDNLYVQPSNGQRFCRECQRVRRRQRTLRDAARRPS